MAINRRDVLRFAAGSGIGAAFTPLPWKLLDDSAIWTQNWWLTPKLPRGEMTTKYTACTLCPAGCGVRARCVGGVPFSLAGLSGHPNGGTLCAAGAAGHHLAYRKDRVRKVLYHGRSSTLAQALQALRAAKGPLAILDMQPGRAISGAYRSFLSQTGGLYLTPRGEEATLEAVRELTGGRSGFGIDLEETRTILSFGAPALDGWASPGRVWAARDRFRLIQADPLSSRTAVLADSWLPIRPGSEAALALAIGHVMLRDGLAHKDALRAADIAEYRKLTERFTPEYASGITGLPAERIAAAAREFASGTPALAIGGGDPAGGPLAREEEIAIAALNLLAGSVGRRGGILARRPDDNERGKDLADIADASLGALLVDASNASTAIPWQALKRKLAPNAVVLAHAPYRTGLARHADFVAPAPSYLESAADVPVPFHSTRNTFAVAPALLPKPQQAIEPAALLTAIAQAFGAPAPGTTEEVMKRRAAAVHATGRGTVFSAGSSKPLGEFKSADEFWTALNEGGCWVDEQAPEAAPANFRLLGAGQEQAARIAAAAEARAQRSSEFPLSLVPRGWSGDAALAPLMTKVYQESQLRRDHVVLDPQTATACGVDDGCEAVVETACGSARVRVKVAASARPEIAAAEIGPRLAGLIDICGKDGCSWRATSARIRRA